MIEDDWRDLDRYVDEMLDIESEGRHAWVDALEMREPEIAKRLRAYLLEHEEIVRQHFLEGSAADLLSPLSRAGQRFGAYTLDRIIGHGGTGTVWLAHRSDGQFEGRAAVKLLSCALVGHPSAGRFAREATVLAKLQHPNIAHLLDAGVASGPKPYLILEYIRGERIDQYCQTRRLSFKQRITLFLDVLTAVAYAHSNFVVHRDLKPTNIFVTEAGVVKLLDFGIAALLSSEDESSAHVTRNLLACLTPGYSAPEQLRSESVSAATDVYALGMILFVLLAGRHPASIACKTPAELIRLTLEGETPRLSEVAAEAQQRRLLRGDLDSIVAKALSRIPADRYMTADLFAQDLRRYLASEPVSARPRSFRYLSAKFLRRHRSAVAVGFAVGAVLVSAAGISTTHMLETKRQRDAAQYEARRAEASGDFLTLLLLSNLAPDRPAPTLHERLELGVDLIDKQYRDDPKFAGRMLVQLANGFRDAREIPRMDELYQEAYDIGRANYDVELMASAQCNRAFGDSLADIGEGLYERIDEGKRLLKQLDRPDTTLRAVCLMAQAEFERGMGHSRSAEALLLQAKGHFEAEGTTYREGYTAVLTELSVIYLDRNQPRELLGMAQLVGRIHEANGRGGTEARLIARQNAATALGTMGEVRAALAEREIINRRAIEHEGAEHTPTLFTVNYAAMLSRMARPAEALKALDKILDRVHSEGDRSAHYAAQIQRADALIQLHRLNDAQAALNEAAAAASSGVGGSPAFSAAIEALLAQLEMTRGALQSAHQHLDRALKLAGYRTDKPERTLAKALLIGARVRLAEGAGPESERFAREALAINEGVARGPDTSANVGEALLRLAQARIKQGKTSGVRSLLNRAVKCLTNGLDANHPLTVEARTLLAATGP